MSYHYVKGMKVVATDRIRSGGGGRLLKGDLATVLAVSPISTNTPHTHVFLAVKPDNGTPTMCDIYTDVRKGHPLIPIQNHEDGSDELG